MKTITVLGLLANNIENRVDELSAFSVMSLGPVVSSTRLTEDEVVRPEDLAVGARSDTIHSARLKVHEDGAWDEPTAAGFVVVDIHALKLKVIVAAVATGGVDTVLGTYHFPEFGSDLVAALASLYVQDLTHFFLFFFREREREGKSV